MRLPGSRNPKLGRQYAPCTLLALNNIRYLKEDFPVMLPQPAVRAPPQQRKRASAAHRTLNRKLIDAVSARLLADGGRVQANGWIAAHCPGDDDRDRPGAHFAFNPQIGVGVCHGRHGRLLLRDLCQHLNINPTHYGGLYAR